MNKAAVLLVIFASQSAYAASPFVGRFRTDVKNCDHDLKENVRSYGKVERAYGAKPGTQQLSIAGYTAENDNGSGIQVILGSGARACLGVTVSGCQQIWNTVISGDTLRSVYVQDMPSRRFHMELTTDIVADEEGLSIKEEVITSSSTGVETKTSFCRLERY